jgi:DNA repair protein RadC
MIAIITHIMGCVKTCSRKFSVSSADIPVQATAASAVIVAHNHPQGELRPSDEYLKITKQLKEAAKVLGLSFLDHIIFNTKGYYSFAEKDEI